MTGPAERPGVTSPVDPPVVAEKKVVDKDRANEKPARLLANRAGLGNPLAAPL